MKIRKKFACVGEIASELNVEQRLLSKRLVRVGAPQPINPGVGTGSNLVFDKQEVIRWWMESGQVSLRKKKSRVHEPVISENMTLDLLEESEEQADPSDDRVQFNIRISVENREFLGLISMSAGKTMSDFVNDIVDIHRKAFNQTIESVRETNAQ